VRDPRGERINPRNLKQPYPVDAAAVQTVARDSKIFGGF
jgi:hypothetical protein